MILETIVSTVNREGEVNFAPMGITLEESTVVLRPFRTSVTWGNLDAVGEGVVNFTDNVLLFARCAMESHVPPNRDAAKVRGRVLNAACSWKEFIVASKDTDSERGRFAGSVVFEGRLRDFVGFNRARHAVIEATILATRLHLLGRERVLEEIMRLRPLVDKTAGAEEREAFDYLVDQARRWNGAR